jgi:hypothetical protein
MPGGWTGVFAWIFVIAHFAFLAAMVATFIAAALDPMWESVARWRKGHGHNGF